MCGIAGYAGKGTIDDGIEAEVLAALRHRGPDSSSAYRAQGVCLFHTRLSIVDIEHGQQPSYNEDGSVVVVFNGEIYNYKTLRINLEKRGHTISNLSDTAILPHLYEEYGTKLFKILDGQFAISVWDAKKRKLVCGRDQLGKLPLFYHENTNSLVFGSTIKSILLFKTVQPVISACSMMDIMTLWVPLGNHTAFSGIRALRPGCFMTYDGSLHEEEYWNLDFEKERKIGFNEAVEQFESLFIESVKKRLMGDVTVSTYLSGGLDSSLVSAIAARESGKKLDTYSVSFQDAEYDESEYQKLVSKRIDSNHKDVRFLMKDFADNVEKCVANAEIPFMRTGPIPIMKLSELVRNNNCKVVLTGEGADEFFGGYDIFRETKIRDFCRRQPESESRRLLFNRINNFVPGMKQMPFKMIGMFYDADGNSDLESHISRFKASTFLTRFLSEDMRRAAQQYDCVQNCSNELPQHFSDYSAIQKAQYLEIKTLLSGYLLSTQGDRMNMANSVEGRYPFLDKDLIAFALDLDDRHKIKVLKEKYIIKQMAARYLPEVIINRQKFPYRAPVGISALLSDERIAPYFQPDMLKKYGIFDVKSVEHFIQAAKVRPKPGEREIMLFMSILTTQILCRYFGVSQHDARH